MDWFWLWLPDGCSTAGKAGIEGRVLEQAKFPGGCASSCKRMGYWFETGALPWWGWMKSCHCATYSMPRAFSAVGGYPQYRHIKPWQVKNARHDYLGAYPCGDTVYPGQGIVGVCPSGIIAAEKLLQDHF